MPKFINHCDHKEEEYRGVINATKKTSTGLVEVSYDLYVFKAFGFINVCLRYGDDPWEYISLGTLFDITKEQDIKTLYTKLLRRFGAKGKIVFMKKRK